MGRFGRFELGSGLLHRECKPRPPRPSCVEQVRESAPFITNECALFADNVQAVNGPAEVEREWRRAMVVFGAAAKSERFVTSLFARLLTVSSTRALSRHALPELGPQRATERRFLRAQLELRACQRTLIVGEVSELEPGK